jgi:hypothetical protein
MSSKKSAPEDFPKILPEFKPLRALWTGAQPPYASEQAARWALRKYREQFAQAEALAVVRGRLLVHPDRFVRVIEKAAIAEVASRAGMAAL